MGAFQANLPSGFVNHAMSVGYSSQLVEASRSVHPSSVPSFESNPEHLMAAFSGMKRKSNPGDQHLHDSIKHPITGCDQRVPGPTTPPGVSNCYIFKSRLQEYAQKVAISTPVYETIKEGPSHEPSFRSTVIVGGVRYDSLPGFFNRKAAEQSAAEVALVELSKCGDKKESISVPVHETGLCKNLLQEYAQKMNYAIPTYLCRKDDTPGRTPLFSCTVEIGGVQYIGAAARTKKEAEIKAARTALLAIQSSGSAGVCTKTQYTVVPCKRKVSETAPLQVETVKAKKPKKSRFKKKPQKPRHCGDSGDQVQAGNLGAVVNSDMGNPVAVEQLAFSDVQVPDDRQTPHCLASSDQDNGFTTINQHREALAGVGSNLQTSAVCDAGQSTISTCQQVGAVNTGSVEFSVPLKDVNNDDVVGNATPMINAPTSGQLDALLLESGTAQEGLALAPTDRTHAGEQYNDHSVSNLNSMVNAPTSGQSDALLPYFEVNQGGPAPPETERSHVREEKNDHVGSVASMTIAPTSGQLDALPLDSVMNQGGSAPLSTDTNFTNHAGEENNGHGLVSPYD